MSNRSLPVNGKDIIMACITEGCDSKSFRSFSEVEETWELQGDTLMSVSVYDNGQTYFYCNKCDAQGKPNVKFFDER